MENRALAVTQAEMRTENIGYADEASEIDLLGNERYIEGLSGFIAQCMTPMTISVQGDWGTGKTTVLKLIEKRLSGQEDIHIVWFKTWQYAAFDGGSNLMLALLYNLYDELDKLDDNDKRTKDRRKNIMKMMPRIFRGIMDNVVGGTFSEMLERAMKNVVLGEEDNENTYKQISLLREQIQSDINELITTDGGRLVIFIDDLDRLAPAAAVELLERLKLFFDCEKCVYVLAMDPDIVDQGVRQKYGESIGSKRAERFFDKIIQLPFYLPVNHYDMRRYVSSFLKDEDEEQREGFLRLSELLVGQNPRSIKRSFNRYRLYKRIYKEMAEDDQELLLFYVLLLEQMQPKLYEQLIGASVKGMDELARALSQEPFSTHVALLGITADESDIGVQRLSRLLENIQ